MRRPDLRRIMDLQQLLVAFSQIERTLPLPTTSQRKENDVEHSYSLAMVAWFLAPYFPHLDRDAAIRIALAHDLVELHAGDTFAYSTKKDKASKHHRELDAIAKIEGDWPDFPELVEAIKSYKERSSAEAKFIYALDKFLPPIINYLNEGRGWHKHRITFSKFHEEKQPKIALSPEVDEYYQELFELLQRQPHLFPSNTTDPTNLANR